MAGIINSVKHKEAELIAGGILNTNFTEYGVYVVSNYSAGNVAVFVGTGINTYIIKDMSGYSASSAQEGSLCFYRSSNGRFELKNNTQNTLIVSVHHLQ